MKKEALIAFDFDGTLYPIDPYDSEQMLMLSCASHKGKLNRKRTKLAVAKDQKGNMDWTSFTASYRQHTRSCTKDQISSVTRDLLKKVHPDQFRHFFELSRFADLVIISCGTENIVQAFLEDLGLFDLFAGIWGKHFEFMEGKVTDMKIHVQGPQDKARILGGLAKDYKHVIAIGDGPTDIPMLNTADLGLIIDWTGKGNNYPFDTLPSLSKACDAALTFLTGTARLHLPS
jgi:phosphoserine phosphatase